MSSSHIQDAKAASAVRYFFGRISRDEAEEALQSAGIREGLYLLRESIMKAGDYVLSICHDGGYVGLRCCGGGYGGPGSADVTPSETLFLHFTCVNIRYWIPLPNDSTYQKRSE